MSRQTRLQIELETPEGTVGPSRAVAYGFSAVEKFTSGTIHFVNSERHRLYVEIHISREINGQQVAEVINKMPRTDREIQLGNTHSAELYVKLPDLKNVTKICVVAYPIHRRSFGKAYVSKTRTFEYTFTH